MLKKAVALLIIVAMLFMALSYLYPVFAAATPTKIDTFMGIDVEYLKKFGTVVVWVGVAWFVYRRWTDCST